MKLIFSDIPDYMHMIRHIYKGNRYSPNGGNIKCFHKMNRMVQVHHHFPVECARGSCALLTVDPSIGHLQHYRKDCVEPLGTQECMNHTLESQLETAIWSIKVSQQNDRVVYLDLTWLKKPFLIYD